MRLRYLASLCLIVSLVIITSCNSSDSSSGDSSDNDITAFSFEAANNSALSADVTGTIDQDNNTITVTIPSITTVTALVATFTTSGTSVTVDGTEQSSGTTANDFSDSATYTVTAEDGTTRDYVVSTTTEGITQQAYIKAVNNSSSDNFGNRISLSGDTLAVGALNESSNQTTITNGTTASSNDDSSNSGAVYIYQRNGTDWSHQAYIKAVNNDSEDYFGYSVSLSGDTLAVGAYHESSDQTTITNGTTAGGTDSGHDESGAVYVYQRSGTDWSQQAYIKAVNNGVDDLFGTSVSLSGDTLAVGANCESSNQTSITNGTTAGGTDDGSHDCSGAAYIYQRSGADWSQQAYIKAVNNSSDDNFGSIVSLSGDTLAVGAYQESSNQTSITNGTTASSDDTKDESGAVYVYQRSGTAWSQQAYIKAVNNAVDDRFGTSVSLSGDTLAVGVNYEDSNQTTITNGTTASSNDDSSGSGAVYVYQRSGTDWSQQAYIKAVNNDSGDYFGTSVSLSGDTLAVAAYFESSNQTTITNGTTASSDNSSTYSGAVYLYQRSGTNWSQQAYIKAVNNGITDMFGVSVSLSGDTLAVGASNEDSDQTTITNGTTAGGTDDGSHDDSGAVYIYH